MTALMSSRLGICLLQYVHRLAGWLKHCSVSLPVYLTSTLSPKHKAPIYQGSTKQHKAQAVGGLMQRRGSCVV